MFSATFCVCRLFPLVFIIVLYRKLSLTGVLYSAFSYLLLLRAVTLRPHVFLHSFNVPLRKLPLTRIIFSVLLFTFTAVMHRQLSLSDFPSCQPRV